MILFSTIYFYYRLRKCSSVWKHFQIKMKKLEIIVQKQIFRIKLKKKVFCSKNTIQFTE